MAPSINEVRPRTYPIPEKSFQSRSHLGRIRSSKPDAKRRASRDLRRDVSAPLSPRLIDLPSGAGRLLQGASGYLATVVRGEVTRRHDEATGARPGRLLRLR